LGGRGRRKKVGKRREKTKSQGKTKGANGEYGGRRKRRPGTKREGKKEREYVSTCFLLRKQIKIVFQLIVGTTNK
jgi:hypothetical protein